MNSRFTEIPTMQPDPYATYLQQADALFAQGEVVKAGQIWQAILKQQPSHAAAREGLLAVKARLLALREASAAAPSPAPPAPAQEPAACTPVESTAPEAPPVEAADARDTAPEAPAPAAEDVRDTAPEAPVVAPVAAPAPIPIPLPDPAPGLPVAPDQDVDRLLAEGCTLYDMGQYGDALAKWERILRLDPTHALARGYANGARRELGLPPVEAVPEAPAPRPEPLEVAEDIDKLLREAVQLYDMGLVEEAITKWERVLALEPQRREVETYLRQARAEVSPQPSVAAAPAAAPRGAAQTADPDALDLKLRQAEHLLQLQRHEEAAFTFQQALGLAPGNARALQGLERCRRPSSPPSPTAGPLITPAPVLSLDDRGRIAMAESPASLAEPQGIEPPAALLQAPPLQRDGLSLPDRLREAVEHAPWLKNPRVLAIGGGSLLVLVVGSGLIHHYRREQALRDDVQAARAAAVAPVAKQAQAPDLGETSEALRDEVETTLVTDPLRAFLRAQTLVSRHPADPSGPQLLEKARAGLPGGVTGASLAEFQKHMQNGDLETAARVMDALLRAQPDSADLRSRAARLHQILAVAHASQGKWEEAREDLRRGRALFPDDKTWQARLKLLERVKTLPKAQQENWVALLG